MLKSEIEKQIVEKLNGKLFVTRGKLRKICGFGDAKVRMITEGLDHIKDDKGQHYLVSDVAAKIAELKTR